MAIVTPIVLGAGSFNTIYDTDPKVEDPAEVFKYAFDHGIRTIDTSAYYGPSEEIVGNALAALGAKREDYVLCTKCCRWETNEFDFSKETVVKSLNRSLQRLKTDYVDILYIHDVEFGSPENVLKAVAAAFALKDEGKVRQVGISGLPLEVLVANAELVQLKLGRSLDAILSYCHLTLQCDLLLKYKEKLEAAGVKTILNASPLSMSLLRSGPTHSFHPAPPQLHERAEEIAQWLTSKNLEIADVATQFSFANWKAPTVIGLKSIKEIDLVLENQRKALQSPDPELWKEIENRFGNWHNFMWKETEFKTYDEEWASAIASARR